LVFVVLAETTPVVLPNIYSADERISVTYSTPAAPVSFVDQRTTPTMTDSQENDTIEKLTEELQLADDDDWLLRGPPPQDHAEWLAAYEQFKEQQDDNDTEQE
jgi:hypothetical protein